MSNPSNLLNDKHLGDTGTWETVPFVSNYYDVPLEWVAHLGGTPYVFFHFDEVRVNNPQDEDDEIWVDSIYALHAVPDDILSALTEKHAIFERWHQAWRAGEVGAMNQHPALKSDRPRYDALLAQVKPWLEATRVKPAEHLLVGRFASGRQEVPAGSSRWGSYEVKWLPSAKTD